MSTNCLKYKVIICISKKVCLIVVALFIIGTTNGQKITLEHQLKMLKTALSELSTEHTDSLMTIPSSIPFKHKLFINDTIEKSIKINEKTTLFFEKKVVMVTSPNGAFLFQIKKKFVEENKDGFIEYYYCTKGNSLYLIIVINSGVYIRKDNSYYSTFFELEKI